MCARVAFQQPAAGLASATGLFAVGDALRLQQQQVQRVRICIMRRQLAQLTGRLQRLGLLSKSAVHLITQRKNVPSDLSWSDANYGFRAGL